MVGCCKAELLQTTRKRIILDYRVVDNKAIHVLVGFNGKRMLIISTCYPDAEHWLADNKTRRK